MSSDQRLAVASGNGHALETDDIEQQLFRWGQSQRGALCKIMAGAAIVLRLCVGERRARLFPLRHVLSVYDGATAKRRSERVPGKFAYDARGAACPRIGGTWVCRDRIRTAEERTTRPSIVALANAIKACRGHAGDRRPRGDAIAVNMWSTPNTRGSKPRNRRTDYIRMLSKVTEWVETVKLFLREISRLEIV